LAVRDLWLARGHAVLGGVNFTIRDRIVVGRTTGQLVALLGPSGVGKTTLLRLIAGLQRPDHGNVYGEGGRPFDVTEVGLVFQDAPLLGHRTLLGNIVVAARVAGLDPGQADKRAHELLERFRLYHRASAYPVELSGGERRRGAIAQQLVRPRRLLLLDEPFAGLDPRSLNDVRSAIVETADADDFNTVLMVTHDIPTAVTTADQIIVLGASAPGQGAVVRATYDLAERGLCSLHSRTWSPQVAVVEIELRFLFASL
jgi:polar amino acid transport system ATP-binding protein/sulfate transport system ATP-binding protein